MVGTREVIDIFRIICAGVKCCVGAAINYYQVENLFPQPYRSAIWSLKTLISVYMWFDGLYGMYNVLGESERELEEGIRELKERIRKLEERRRGYEK